MERRRNGSPTWGKPARRSCRSSPVSPTRRGGRFKRANRDTLEEMRLNDRDAWNTVELRLADQYRELGQAQHRERELGEQGNG